jgi:hypothetical protein
LVNSFKRFVCSPPVYAEIHRNSVAKNEPCQQAKRTDRRDPNGYAQRWASQYFVGNLAHAIKLSCIISAGNYGRGNCRCSGAFLERHPFAGKAVGKQCDADSGDSVGDIMPTKNDRAGKYADNICLPKPGDTPGA